jgi:predicted DNA-binding transcriptional regulator YafY
VEELAAQLRVGRRTIHRDLAVLQQGSERIEFVESNGQGPVCLGCSVLEPRGIRC